MRWLPKNAGTPYSAHMWFAWYPVVLATGEHVWLERVWRMATSHYAGDYWHYADSQHRVEQEARKVALP